MKVTFLPNNTKTVQCKIESPLSVTTEEVEATVDPVPTAPKVIKCKKFTRIPIIPDRTGEQLISVYSNNHLPQLLEFTFYSQKSGSLINFLWSWMYVCCFHCKGAIGYSQKSLICCFLWSCMYVSCSCAVTSIHLQPCKNDWYQVMQLFTLMTIAS